MSETATQPKSSGNRFLSLQRKSAARLAAVQCLYQRMLNPDAPFDAVQLAAHYKEQYRAEDTDEDRMNGVEPDYAFLRKLLTAYTATEEALNIVKKNLLAEAWNKDRLSPVIEAIFEAACVELSISNLQPVKVIDEYVSIAGQFYDEKEISFVNGVLRQAAEQLAGLAPKAPAADADEGDEASQVEGDHECRAEGDHE